MVGPLETLISFNFNELPLRVGGRNGVGVGTIDCILGSSPVKFGGRRREVAPIIGLGEATRELRFEFIIGVKLDVGVTIIISLS